MKYRNEIIEILNLIDTFSSKFPKQRFGQILFNLNINQFETKTEKIRDIYNDLDIEILERIKNKIK